MRVLVLAISLVALSGCDDFKKGFDAGYDKNFRETCTSSATSGGVPADTAKKLCDCAMDKINQRYSASEKMSVPDEQLRPIMSECMKGVVTSDG